MIKSAISGILLWQKLDEYALFNEVSYSTYARPGELLKMKAEDFVERNQDFQHSVLVVAPIERGEASKAGIYDEVLILDDQTPPWLEKVLCCVVTWPTARGWTASRRTCGVSAPESTCRLGNLPWKFWRCRT